jgi:uncharacterized circularly permuted ATP-grasp superfamily protein
MADSFSNYPLGAAWDEMFAAPGEVRPAYHALLDIVSQLGTEELGSRVDTLSRVFLDRGVTFALGGEEQPFPLDVVPRIVEAAEWQVVERGVTQRVRALEAFLTDVYGPGRAFADGVIPRRVVLSSAHFHREAAGITPANGVRITIAGTDVIRDEQGVFRVLEDNVRTPSGVSYVMENRRAMTQAFSEAFASHRVMPVQGYPHQLLAALLKAAPVGVQHPTVVVLTPGVFNSAYFEHALLARLMGVELVEGRDLFCAGNGVFMRTTAGEQPVHVIYRRTDDEWLDPLHFRGDSLVGCPGLLNAARAGQVTLANAVGNGVADDKLVYTYVPDLVRYYLGEEPLLDNVETHRLDDPDERAWVLEHLEELVLKPVDGSGGKGIVIGPDATAAELTELRLAVMEHPRQWIAQRVVQLSTAPTLCEGTLAPRHLDLRPFSVNSGDGIWVLPGGLTRVALGEGKLVVNSSQGGGSKDTWVLAPAGTVAVPHEGPARVRPDWASGDEPDAGPFAQALAAQQQQQQQSGGFPC